MKFRYPKRWSRAKRKARRAVDIRAWRFEEFMRVYKEMLDKIWGDAPDSLWARWEEAGSLLIQSGGCLDDVEASE